MKKRIFYSCTLLLSMVLIVSIFTGCGGSTSKTSDKKVRLNEVVRSVFYAPMYAAINQGYFKEEGLDIELSTGQGADTTPSKTQVGL